MLSGHPYIRRAYIKEAYAENGQLLQKLIVETKLKNPAHGDHSDSGKWSKLQNSLTNLAANGFADFTSIEMRGVKD